jgi:peroxiredoxin
MIKQILVVVSTLLTTSVFSQKKIQEKSFPFKIDGSIRNFSGKTIYLHHKWNEITYTDSAKINAGSFLFNLKGVEPSMYWFTLTNDVNGQPSVPFFSDATTIKANLIGDSLNYSGIMGGSTQVDYMEYRAMINNLIMQQQRMQAEYTTASQTGDNVKMQALQLEFQGLNKQYIDGLKAFIKGHPKSVMSGFILANDMNNENVAFEDVVASLADVDKSLENNSYVKSVAKRVNNLKGTMIGYKANNFTQTTPEGKPLQLSDFKGKYVLIDFWASWCKPCRMENPNVVAAYNRFKDKNFTVLGVSMDSNKDLWIAAIKADNLTWPHVSDLRGWGNEVGAMYGVKGIPQNFLIDKEGKIVAKNLRGADLDQKLAEIIK